MKINKTPFYIFIAASALTACGGSDSSGGVTNNSDSSAISTKQIKPFGQVQIQGVSKKGTVEISTFKQLNKVLKRSKTNDSGEFSLNDITINPNSYYVLKFSPESKKLNGSLKTIILGKDLKKKVNINILSDLAYRQLDSKTDESLIEEKLNQFSQNIIQDINDDKKVNYNDITYFNNSKAQQTKLLINIKSLVTDLQPVLLTGLSDTDIAKLTLLVLNPSIDVAGGSYQEASSKPISLNLKFIPQGYKVNYYLNGQTLNAPKVIIQNADVNKLKAEVVYKGKSIYDTSVFLTTVDAVKQDTEVTSNGIQVVSGKALKGSSIFVPIGESISNNDIQVYSLGTTNIPYLDGTSLTNTFKLGPAGTKFKNPVTVSIPVDLRSINDTSKVFVIHKSSDGSIDSIKPEKVDKKRGIVIFKTSSFSNFEVRQYHENTLVNKVLDKSFDNLSFLSDEEISSLLETEIYSGITIYDYAISLDSNRYIKQMYSDGQFLNAIALLQKDIDKRTRARRFVRTLKVIPGVYWDTLRQVYEEDEFIDPTQDDVAGVRGRPLNKVTLRSYLINNHNSIFSSLGINKSTFTSFSFGYGFTQSDSTQMFSGLTNQNLKAYYQTGDSTSLFTDLGKNKKKVFTSIIDEIKKQNDRFNQKKAEEHLVNMILAAKYEKDSKNNEDPVKTTKSDAELIEAGVDKLVGYWKTTCLSASNGSKHYYIKFKKQNDTSVKIVNNLVQRFSSSNCTGSSQTSVNNDGSGGVLTVQNPTNNGKTFSDGDGGKFTFNSDNKITVVSDVTEVWNRISATQFPSVTESTGKVVFENGETYPLRASFTINSDGLIKGGNFDYHKDSNGQPCVWSSNNTACYGVSGSFGTTSQSGKLTVNGASSSMDLMASGGYKHVFDGKINGKKWSGTLTIDGNKKGSFSVETTISQ